MKENNLPLHECDGKECYCGATSRTIQVNLAFSAIRRLSGVIYTLIDASIENENKAKAMKDLIRKELSNTFEELEQETTQNGTLTFATGGGADSTNHKFEIGK